MTRRVKVLIVAEGPSEIGQLDQPHAPGSRRQRRIEGFLPPILRKLIGRPLEITAQRVQLLRPARSHQSLDGHARRAAGALALAVVDDCDLVVFVKDVDRATAVKKTELERKRKLSEMHLQIETGFAAVRGEVRVMAIKATPCRMIEAWALGDAAAVRSVSKWKKEIPNSPEKLWGNESDRNSMHPKCVLARIFGREPCAVDFETIATEAVPETLGRTCPDSFAPFAREVEVAARKLA